MTGSVRQPAVVLLVVGCLLAMLCLLVGAAVPANAQPADLRPGDEVAATAQTAPRTVFRRDHIRSYLAARHWLEAAAATEFDARQSLLEAEPEQGRARAKVKVPERRLRALTKAADRAAARRRAAEVAVRNAMVRARPGRKIDDRGCPTVSLPGTVPRGLSVADLCAQALLSAPNAKARRAIAWALRHLGAPYACDGTTRMDLQRYDCSSFVSRAYAEGAKVPLLIDGWAPTTSIMRTGRVRGVGQVFAPLAPSRLRPGDLVLYRTCGSLDCRAQRHVVMYLGRFAGRTWMVHVNRCGGVSHVTDFWGVGGEHDFLGARRVTVAMTGPDRRAGSPQRRGRPLTEVTGGSATPVAVANRTKGLYRSTRPGLGDLQAAP